MARALIADDDPDIREIVQRFLTADGHEVVATTDGAEAIEKLADEVYDIVVLDVEMPHMNGLQVLAAAAQLPPPRPPVLMLTGLASAHDRRRALDAGAADYLTKPVTRSDFMAVVDRVLQTRPTGHRQPATRNPHPGP